MQQTEFFPLTGGLDLITPAIVTPAGRAIAAINYEPHPRGYRRVEGIEVFDGQPAPSDAEYWVLNFDTGTAAIAEGNTVTGATSAATGKALIAGVVETGTYGGGNAAGYLVLTNVSGTFQDNEALQVAAVTKCLADGTAAIDGADNDTDDATWTADAIETARALIAKPTGEGPVRGVATYAGNIYCWRNNVGSTAKVMYKATTAGWVAQDLGRSLSFTSGGVTEIVAGNTITGATSAATAVIRRVILDSGTWAAGTAAGRFVVNGQVGTFQAENLNVGASPNLATIAGNSTAVTLAAGGHVETTNHNFYGASNLNRMYFCDGVSPAYEFDGTVAVAIPTGMTVNTPGHLAAHKQHLFLSFPGGSLQYSPIGDPTATWTPVLGAGEIGLGHNITSLIPSAGAGIMTIFGGNTVANLYGSSSIDWDLVILTEDAGGKEWTPQLIGGRPIYEDDRGLRSLSTTSSFGDFRMGTISQNIEPLLRSKDAGGITPTCSLRDRTKDQYRLFFSDGSGVIAYFGRKTPECMVFDYGSTIVAFCAHASGDEATEERLFIGAEDGFVYEVDSGNSMNGAVVNAYIRLPFVNLGAPQVVKRWTKVSLEVDANPTTELSLIVDFDYADPEQAPSLDQQFTIRGGGGFWDEANWDEFYWSSPVNGVAECHISGIGRNMSLTVISSDRYESPHTLQGVTLHYSPRKLKR